MKVVMDEGTREQFSNRLRVPGSTAVIVVPNRKAVAAGDPAEINDIYLPLNGVEAP